MVLCEEVDEVAGGASGMDVDSISEVGDRASEGQAAGMYGTDITAESHVSNFYLSYPHPCHLLLQKSHLPSTLYSV